MTDYFKDLVVSPEDTYAPIREVTIIDDEDYQARYKDLNIVYTNLTASRTVTLPSAEYNAGLKLTVVDGSGKAGTYNIVIQPDSNETISGHNSVSISVDYGAIQLMSDGHNWVKLSATIGDIDLGELINSLNTGWLQHSFTPTINSVSNYYYNDTHYVAQIDIDSAFSSYFTDNRRVRLLDNNGNVYFGIALGVNNTTAYIYTDTVNLSSITLASIYTSHHINPLDYILNNIMTKSVTDTVTSSTALTEVSNSNIIIPQGKWLIQADVYTEIKAKDNVLTGEIGGYVALSTSNTSISDIHLSDKIIVHSPTVTSDNNSLQQLIHLEGIINNTSDTSYKLIIGGYNNDSEIKVYGDRTLIKVIKMI